MKTSDMIQMGALAVVAFLAFEKFAGAKTAAVAPTGSANVNSSPAVPPAPPDNFGVTDPGAGWDDANGVSTLDAIIGSVF